MLRYYNTSTIYISQKNGADGNNGYAPQEDGMGNGPIKTIDRLRYMLLTMRSSGVRQPITVKFMGDYYMEEPLELGSMWNQKCNIPASGKIRNILFESYGKDRARLIGGKKLTGFQKDVFNGVECLSLYVPEVKEGKWHFTDLYVNGAMASRTRYPRKGTLTAVTTEFPYPESQGGKLFGGSKWFVARKEDLEQISGVENAIVSFYHYWVDEHTEVESFDRDTGKIMLKNRSRYLMSTSYNENPDSSVTSDFYYYLENIPQTFGNPGEWYLDVANGMVYYIPEFPDVEPETLEFLAPTLEQLALFQGRDDNKISGIRFRNLDFICSKGDYVSRGDNEEGYASDCQAVSHAYGAISFEYAEDCEISQCNLSCLGIHAVEIKKGCQSIRIEKNNFKNLGGGAVKIMGGSIADPIEWNTGYCVIRGNKIQHCGKRHAAACGILASNASHNEIADNEIAYLDYTGISAGWTWGYTPSISYGNIIRNNHIHHIGMGRLSDMGGIYTLGAQNGTIIEGNLIHDVKSAHYGGWGIYTDEGSSYITITGNIVYNVKSNAFHQHYGSFNTVKNNIFAFSGDATIKVTRKEEHLGVILEDNVFLTNGEPVYAMHDIKNCINYPSPCMQAHHNKIWDVSGNSPIMFKINTPEEKCVSFDEWQKIYNLDEGSMIEMPGENILNHVNMG